MMIINSMANWKIVLIWHRLTLKFVQFCSGLSNARWTLAERRSILFLSILLTVKFVQLSCRSNREGREKFSFLHQHVVFPFLLVFVMIVRSSSSPSFHCRISLLFLSLISNSAAFSYSIKYFIHKIELSFCLFFFLLFLLLVSFRLSKKTESRTTRKTRRDQTRGTNRFPLWLNSGALKLVDFHHQFFFSFSFLFFCRHFVFPRRKFMKKKREIDLFRRHVLRRFD